MQIQAAVARKEGGPLELATLDISEPQQGEVRVRVHAVGVCHTDAAVLEGLMGTAFPVVLGHEGAGIVESVGAGVTKVAPGDHVVMTVNSCGHCPACLDHEVTYCHEIYQRNFLGNREDGTSALSEDGQPVRSNFFGQSSFGTYAICHEANVVKVSKDVPLEMLGPLGCGFQTGAGTALNALQVRAGKSFAIFGAGAVGLAALMAARAVGVSRIIAIDRSAERLALAKELGASDVIDATSEDAAARIMALTGYGVDHAMDTTGVPAVIRTAVESLAPRGACAIVGASGPDAEITLNETHLMSAGRKIFGVVEGAANPDTFIPMLIELWQDGRFPFDKLVRFYEFEQINQAFEDSAKGKTVKPILRLV